MLEVKKLEDCTSSNYPEDICSCIFLSKYADKDSVKCVVANIGDEIIPDSFNYAGDPIFSYDVYKKYAKGNYSNVYIEVIYNEKELELSESIFNTAEGIDNYIKDLETLHHIINIRLVAHRRKKMKLEAFVWRGILYFDELGQTSSILILQKEIKSGINPEMVSTKTLSESIFRMYYERWGVSNCHIPQQGETCQECGKEWTIHNIEDHIDIENSNYKRIGFHKNCFKIFNSKKQLKEFKEVFSKIYSLDQLIFITIPNEYCSCDHCPPWCIVSTPDGDIKIGWRKRVVNIEWLDNYKQFDETFENEKVTRGFNRWENDRYIHADGIEKALEYVKRAQLSIKNKGF